MNVKRRVLHVGPAATKGGMGRTIQRLHGNPPDNWDSDIVATHADGGVFSILRAWNRGKRNFIRKLNQKPDLIHIHTATKASWYRKRKIIQLANRQDIPVIVHLHSGFFDRFGKGLIGKDISRILSLNNVNPVVLSDHWKQWLQPMISNKVRIIPNPYREGLLPISSDNRDINMLLMVGRPSRIKGHSIAINAVKQLRNEGYEVYLHLAGINLQDLDLKITSQDGIITEGWMEDNELDILINKAGFLLMPSEHEGMPLSLLDALATGLPAIVSPACSSFINQGGIVIKERTIQAWKKGIKAQIENKEQWKMLSLNSPKDVKGLDSESDRKRWENIYNEIIDFNLMNQ